jgi:membrane peptidoglycan carboxypeptidase
LRKLDVYLAVKHHRSALLARRETASRGFRRMLLGGMAALGVALAAALLLLGSAYASLTAGLPSLQTIPAMLELPNGLYLQPTRLYDRSGQHLLLTLENPGVKRRYLPLNEDEAVHLSPELARVTVATLDPTFWSNPGFTLSAGYQTLAQRLVSSLLLADEPPGWQRDLRVRLLAGQISATYGRQKVLEWYLNSAYYGHLAYGADTAAQTYLGKSAASLDLAESALLVAVSQAPALNPIDAPDAALADQREVLAYLLAQGSITRTEFDQASRETLSFQAPPTPPANPAPDFTRLALDQLAARFGREKVERGGLTVITSLDYDLQLQVECAAQTQLLRATGDTSETRALDGSDCSAARLLPTLPPADGNGAPAGLSASAEVLDPSTGEILALIGGVDGQGKSAGLSRRPPGSLLTPFVYLSAFTRGMAPASLVWDIPASLPADEAGQKEPDGSFHGPVRLRVALANDYLAPADELLARFDPQNVWQLAAQLGLNGLDQAGDGILFNGGEVSLPDVAQSFGVFAQSGVLAGQPSGSGTGGLSSSVLLRVENQDGSLLLDASQPQARLLLSPQLAYLVNNVLSDETARWPSLGYPNALEVGKPAGAKLGQTADGQDVWAAGYTPQRVVVAWVGNPSGSKDAERVDLRLASGLWHALIQYATRDLPAEGWSAPPGVSTVEVCDPSGLLPTSICPNVVSEVFLDGNQPTSQDNLYRAYQVNRETGRLATVFTPPELVDARVYLVVPPEAQSWAEAAGLPSPPQNYDAIQAPVPSVDAHITSPGMFADVRGKLQITGTAAGANFGYYRVQVGQGINPQSWIQVGQDGSAAVNEGVLAEWDASGLSGLYAVRLLVVSKDQRVLTATIQVTVDNQPPEVQIVYPTQGQSLLAMAGRAIALQTDASDDIGLARVELYVDGNLVAALTQPPYSFPWQGAVGKHTFTVKAYDRAGNSASAGPVTFTISP